MCQQGGDDDNKHVQDAARGPRQREGRLLPRTHRGVQARPARGQAVLLVEEQAGEILPGCQDRNCQQDQGGVFAPVYCMQKGTNGDCRVLNYGVLRGY